MHNGGDKATASRVTARSSLEIVFQPYGRLRCLTSLLIIQPLIRVAAGAEIESQPMPPSLHNLMIVGLSAMVLLWMAKIAVQMYQTGEIYFRMTKGRPVHLQHMSIYTESLQQLARQHFNQILRMRRTVAPKSIPRHVASVHVRPESVSVSVGDAEAQQVNAGGSADKPFGVSFTVDASVACQVTLFWGVSLAACTRFLERHIADTSDPNELFRRPSASSALSPSRSAPTGSLELQQLVGPAQPLSPASSSSGAATPTASREIFAPAEYIVKSSAVGLTGGVGVCYSVGATDMVCATQFPFDLSAPGFARRPGASQLPEDALVPLVIVASSQSTDCQLTFVRFKHSGHDGGVPSTAEAVRQIAIGAGCAYELQGMYGFEDEGELDCMVCFSRPKNVCLLPCRHCSVCHACLRSLRDEKCPLCRSSFTSYVTFGVSRDSVPRTSQTSLPSLSTVGI